ncbi:IPT/TIG domain-containing protein [Bradyrhizobium sp. USDA 4506]
MTAASALGNDKTPTVTSISPTWGSEAGGTKVKIEGAYFLATGVPNIHVSAVKFGNADAQSFEVRSEQGGSAFNRHIWIQAVSPAGTGTVDITVVTNYGTSATSAADRFSYVGAPTVTSLSPTSGPEAGGTVVTITGSNLANASAVTFGASAARITANSATSLTVTSPAGSGVVDVTVTTPGGTVSPGRFTYAPAPTVTSLSPTSGPEAGGTVVTISGSNLANASAVTFGASAARITANSATSLTVTSPAGSGVVDVTVTTPGGTVSPGRFSYVAAPTATSLSPTSGPEAGGTVVTIAGTNLANASAVTFGASAARITANSATSLTVTSPAGSGVVDVTVTTPGGTVSPGRFTYAPAPTATSLSPTSGPEAGGTVVTISGSNLANASAVTFGASAARITANSATSLTVTSPAGTGVVDVTVTTPGGTVSPGRFSYVAAPTATSLSPTSGPEAGGTVVTIAGTNLANASAVTFGTSAARITANSATSLTVTSPAGSGVVDVTVTTPGGTVSPGRFSYVGAPTVTSLSPTSGPEAGGTVVTISGTNLANASAVKFGASAATSFTVNSATSLIATAPAGTGVVDVVVTTPGGTSATSAADQYTYAPAPTATSLSPTSGPEAGGTSVTITGTNLANTISVWFGPNMARITAKSATSITTITPRGTGTVDVVVNNPGGRVSPGRFSYVGAPTATSLSPTSGPEAGGTVVTISGSNLANASAVTFGASAARITANSATSLTVTSPAGTGVVDVTVTTPGGTVSPGRFSYVAAPTATSLSPTSGPEAGGTVVTIAGTNLANASAVTFGTSAARITANSATSLTVTSPAGSGVVDVTVTTPGGTVSPGRFSYVAAPTATSLSPTSGPEAGGTVVTIAGTNLANASAVTFGTSAARITANSATSLTVTSPAGSGVVDVTVTTPGGTVSPGRFTYAPAPTATSLSPTSGPEAGGTVVTISGSNLANASAVTFGASAARITANSATSLTVTSPAGTGVVDVTVTTPGGTVSPGRFSYVAAPTATSLSPTSGPEAGGTVVTIAGSNLANASAVTFGASAARITANSATSLTVTSPAGTGVVDVTVTTPGGTVSPGRFSYVAAPTATSLSPTSGPEAGGTVVTIAGTNLANASAVTFGTSAARITANSATSLTVTSPAGSGVVDVTVTTPGGTVSPGRFSYVGAPTVTSLSPTSGPEAGGTVVTISGTNLANASAVKFGASAATSFTVNSATSLIATAPAGTGVVDVVVTTPGGTSATSAADQYTYAPAPTATSLSPTSGPEAGGTSVTITGTNLANTISVWFGPNMARITAKSATSITTITPRGTGTVDVVVNNPGGRVSPGRFSYVGAPTATSLSPTSGPEAGGTVVTISGSNLANASAVTFGASAARITANSATSLTVTSPAGTGVVDVTVTTPGGTVSPGRFTYVGAPTVTSLSPTSGPEAGGTVVTISGSNLANASAVTFGASAARITANSATSLTVTSPAGTGVVDVTVTTPGGTVSPGRFSYVAAPTATSLSPTSGPEAGGTVVTIAGSNLANASAVTFGASAARIMANSATSLTVTSPAGTGVVDVTVTTPGGTVSPGRFSYVAAPTATSLSPTSGPEAGGTVVTIAGTNLANASAVTFGTSAARITANSATSLTVTSPAGSGVVDVTVTTPGGTVSPGRFSYVGAPTVTSLSPTSGPEAGGTVVTISGTNLANASAVKFGASAATSFTVNSATSLIATAPAGTGVVDVVVTTPGGTSATSAADQYTYAPAPTATSLSPTSGPEAGGTSVTITGTNLANTISVWFGPNMARITAKSATSITTITPRGTGTVDVVVNNPGGRVSPGRFSYVGAPTATSLSPTSGPEAGGTVVTISGSNLANASAVTFGASAARITANSATSLTVTSPAGTGVVDVTVTTPGGTVSPGRFTYVGAPTATSLSPTSGPEAGGTVVTIAGTNLANASAVTFGTSAARITANSATSLTVTSPAGSGVVDVTVTTPGGTVSPGRFTYAPAPTATSLSPTSGPEAGGTVVTIAGTNLANASAVTFGASAARITANTATSLTVTSPAGTGVVDVTVTTPGGTVSPGRFSYVGAPTVTSLSPTSGPEAGGTVVTISGTNLANASAVKFGASAATSFTVNSATSLIATAPAGTGVVDVVVTTPGGTSATSAADQYTYAPAPTATSLSPTSGPEAGGTSVTITGTNLANTISVWFGPNMARITAKSATSITTITPRGTGTVDVVVNNPGGRVSPGRFSYVGAPTATSLSPTSGPEAGGTVVTISGSNLANASAVTFGASAARITANSATSLTVTSPAGTGVVDVTVTTPGGTVSPGRFSYVAAPTATSLSPTSGPEAGGTVVTISGSNLANASAVTFGTSAARITANSATSLTVTSPAGSGVVDVTVTTPGGTVSPGRFTYAPAPTATSLSPTSGPEAGGTVVTIAGTNLANASAVTFGASAARITANTATSLTVTSPAGTGVVDVTVTTPGGTVSPGRFSYVGAPTVTSLSPTSGPEAGGTVVTISGTNLANASAVTFGTSAARITANSATSLTVTSPAGSGVVDVTVTTPGGTVSPGRFSYVGAPTVTSLSPTSGPEAGGTVVTISGTNLANASAVKFGASAATSFTVNSATSLIATAPAGTGVVDVVVTTPGGTSATSAADQYTYAPAPTATSLSPTSGPEAGGTSVTITGTNLANTISVWFGPNMARITAKSATSITTITPRGTGTVDVVVNNPGGRVSPGRFSYVGAPTATSLSPTSGPEAGGTVVTISGSNLANASAVTFGASAARITANSATSLTVTSPAGTGVVDVTVTTPGGTVSPGRFSYVAAPTATSLSPTSGPEAGGTVVTIAGTNLANASAVTFGASAARITANSATSLTVTSPAGSGVVDVTVTTPGGTVSPGRFTYAPAPTATSLSPTSGPEAGGTVVTISGSNLANASAVTFGASAARITANSATSLTVTSPAGTGVVDVTVTTPGGTVSPGRFSYVAAPTATSLSPTSGPEAGGTVVTIAGTNLANASAVTFGTSAARITANSATSLTVTSPAGSGVVDVTVTTPGGTVSPGRFTYAPAPTATVTSLSPASGPASGGTSVTITGTGLTGASAVKFGASAATSFTVNSATSISATAPAGTGTVDVTVTTPGGTSATSAADKFSYQAITSVTLASSLNPSSYGQPVTLTATVTGSGGTPAGTVVFKDAGAVIGSATLSAGIASFATTTLAVGTHSITASYGGNTVFAASTSPVLSQTVNIPADSVKLRQLQVNLSRIVAQNSGQAISGAIDDAISEGFAQDWIFATPGQLGVRFNFAADPYESRDDQGDAASTSGTGPRSNIFDSGAGNAYGAAPASGGSRRNPASRINDTFAAIDPQTPRKVSPKRIRENKDWLFWVDVRGTGLDRLTSTTTAAGMTTTAAPLYGLQVNALAGLTYRMLPNFLVGVVGGYETFNYTEQDINGKLTGNGWTVGSYLGWKITPSLRYDAAVAYSGIGYNGVAGTAQGNFSGNRWMLSTGLTGTYQALGFTIEPSAKVYALWEKQGAYVDSLGTRQANYDFSTGRASGGVKLVYPFTWADSILLAPYAGVYGDYYFNLDDAAAILQAGGLPLASTPLLQGWSARAAAGINARFENGVMVGAGAEYGGIGANFQTWTVKLRGQMPFNAQ